MCFRPHWWISGAHMCNSGVWELRRLVMGDDWVQTFHCWSIPQPSVSGFKVCRVLSGQSHVSRGCSKMIGQHRRLRTPLRKEVFKVGPCPRSHYCSLPVCVFVCVFCRTVFESIPAVFMPGRDFPGHVTSLSQGQHRNKQPFTGPN